MIIYGFADSINECGEALTGDNSFIVSQRDQWSPRTQNQSTVLAGAGGAFRAFSDASLPQARTLKTSGIYVAESDDAAQEGAEALKEALEFKRSSKIWWINQSEYYPKAIIRPGTVRYSVSGDITLTTATVDYLLIIFVNDDGQLTKTSSVALGAGTTAYTISDVPSGSLTQWFIGFQKGISTVQPARKLSYSLSYTLSGNATGKDAPSASFDSDLSDPWPLRWAYADLVSAYVTENKKTLNAANFDAEFFLYEGVRYGRAYEETRTHLSATTFNITYKGTYEAPIKFEYTAGGTGSTTSVTFTNNTDGNTFTWTGSLLSSQTIIVDARTWTVTKDGADDYDALTVGTGQTAWSYIAPDSSYVNSFTITVGGTSSQYTYTIYFDEAYLL